MRKSLWFAFVFLFTGYQLTETKPVPAIRITSGILLGLASFRAHVEANFLREKCRCYNWFRDSRGVSVRGHWRDEYYQIPLTSLGTCRVISISTGVASAYFLTSAFKTVKPLTQFLRRIY